MSPEATRLRRALLNTKRKVVIVAGAGVSASATGGKQCSTWTGLISHALDYCRREVPRFSEKKDKTIRNLLDDGDPEFLISAAELIEQVLKKSGYFATWLRESVGDLSAESTDLLEVLKQLARPICTTNYDSLLSVYLQRDHVSWKNEGIARTLLTGEEKTPVVHLHGHWAEPDSVILGIRDYERITSHKFSRALMQCLGASQTMLFVGFGAGLDDPNFGAFLRWHAEVFKNTDSSHFRLCRTSDTEILSKEGNAESRIELVSYGASFEQLPIFLRQLTDERDVGRPIAVGHALPRSSGNGSGKHEERSQLPRIHLVHDFVIPSSFVGREKQIKDIEDAIMLAPPGRTKRSSLITIRAVGGVGKSCLAAAVMDRFRRLSRFQQIIWFSFYESTTEDSRYFFREVLNRLGLQTDLSFDKVVDAGGSPLTVLRKELSRVFDQTRTLVILDGLEVIQKTSKRAADGYGQFLENHREVGSLLKHFLTQEDSVALITTRVRLTEFQGLAGHLEVSLPTLTPSQGAELLRSLGVFGTEKQLQKCVHLLGGHALSLRAGGKYLELHGIPADKINELIGDSKAFQNIPEGAKVKKIVDSYRQDLSEEQERFLKMLSIHPRSISEEQYPALVRGYGEGGKDTMWVRRELITPLVGMGLLEILTHAQGKQVVSSHPLMKTAYSLWLGAEETLLSHREWATVAQERPFVFVERAQSIEELQDLLDALEHYLEANDIRQAWRIFWHQNVGARLEQLGYFSRCLSLSERLSVGDRKQPALSDTDRMFLFERLARCSGGVGDDKRKLRYRRKQLQTALATKTPSWIEDSKEHLASGLLDIGSVEEATAIGAKSVTARAILAIAKGRYSKAISLLGAVFTRTNGHDKTAIAQIVAEALYRSGQYQRAARVLKTGTAYAEKMGFTCCWISLKRKWIDLDLRRNRVATARIHQDELNKEKARIGLAIAEHKLLLIREGQPKEILKRLEKSMKRSDDVADRLENLSIKTSALLAVGNTRSALREMNQALELQASTGFLKRRDEFHALAKKLRRPKGTGR